MIKLAFYWYILTGQIVPQQEQDCGHTTYAILFKDGKAIDYAYKEEIEYFLKHNNLRINADKTAFVYNEDLHIKSLKNKE